MCRHQFLQSSVHTNFFYSKASADTPIAQRRILQQVPVPSAQTQMMIGLSDVTVSRRSHNVGF